MGFQKAFSLILVAGSLATGYAGYKAKVAVHPDIAEQLSSAIIQVQNGNATEAAVKAKSLLIGEKITVAVNYGSTPEKQRKDCDVAIDRAFEMWETALDNTVNLERTNDPKQAMVTIHFEKDVTLKKQVVSGFITWTRTTERSRNGIKMTFDADIHLRTMDPYGRPMNAAAMSHTCGHELGHMFGLDDSNLVGPLMGPLDLRKPAAKPTPDEVETVRAIRTECNSILETASAKGTHGHAMIGFGHTECKH